MIIKDALGLAGGLPGESPRLDLEIILANVLGTDRTFLFTWPDKRLSAEQEKQFQSLFERRVKGEPVAYIVGQREFWSLSLECNNSTLIPRPDTECLVEVALKHLPDKSGLRVLDLGTGTGAVALAIASERHRVNVIAADLAEGAVSLAKKNTRALGFKNVQVMQSDWFTAVEGTFDLIVSNPPYIDPADVHLNQGDVRFEPRTALVSESQGIADIEHIICSARAYLNDGAWLLLEHGYQQAAQVRTVFSECGYTGGFSEQDLSNNDRVTGACWAGGKVD